MTQRPPPTIRYSKGFNCLILETDEQTFHFWPEMPEHWGVLISILRRWADRDPDTHAAKDAETAQWLSPEERQRITDEYFAKGGKVTSRGVRPKLEELEIDLGDLK